MAHTAANTDIVTAFAPARLRPRHDGWTAERQRVFIATPAETGCISDACAAARITPKSAYRLRAHPEAAAFVEAWDRALVVATGRLASIAFDRAVKGTTREYWKDGECVAGVRQPSDRLLMVSRARLPGLLAGLVDVDCPADPLGPGDYRPHPLIDEDRPAQGGVTLV